MDRISIVYHRGIADYDFGSDYPIRGKKFPLYLELLKSRGLLKRYRIEIVEPKAAVKEDLLLVHSEEYIDRVEKLAKERAYLSDDTPLTPAIVRAARLIVGAALKAGKLVAKGDVELAQGVGGGLHHAGRDYGGGFCIFNDVAACAMSLVERHGLERVLIFDTDAHAGNGTMDIFYEEPRVLYLSVHQDPRTLFPNTGFVHQIGRDRGEGYTVNVPLPPEADDGCMSLVLERVFKPLVRQFRPQVIIRSGGADPHFQDELADLGLTFRGLWSVGRAVVEAAERAGCGLVDLLCSGYNPGTEEQGLYALFSGELGIELELRESQALEPVDPRLLEKTGDVIDELAKILKPYWTLG